jgi:hypothetical protein
MEKVMETHPLPITGRTFPMAELEHIESAIQVLTPCVSTFPFLRPCVSTLEACRASLFQQLDRITRPGTHTHTSQVLSRGFSYRGVHHPCWNAIAIHIELLRQLWTDFPERRPDMANAMARYGRNRAYVATDVALLFLDKPLAWSKRHSRSLVDGWHVDTNLSTATMRRILPAAADAAGLRWGFDVMVYWQSTAHRANAIAHSGDHL